MLTNKPDYFLLNPSLFEKRTILDIYDEEFFTNLKLAKNMIQDMTNDIDKGICRKWMARLCSMKSSDPVVKKNRNEFFQYLLQMMKLYAEREKVNVPKGEETEAAVKDKCSCRKDYMAKWSPDRRTYIAMKPLPGKGALIYMAVTKDPSLGWEHS
ncbi:uncharacterized protein LOC109609263 [Aethina tumida]|uniref:uncharacterized protein LOC109609263 n=1 Tax=Aethina tumida TaxID=116153 RepID=UPI00096B1D53|nr:uncharacterized protein LOC109609263 [Aethina tumida]XP_019881463.1 uncharacterized protein LOC109609263 [Aethina tumida]